MQFAFQALTWGFLITLVPVLIHLINMMRHRRVKWAAMEFLLQSYKKHRKWIWLKQLLLLLLRMAAIAVVVAMLAQWISQQQFLPFGGQATHHYIVLDDSYSMSQRHQGATAFEKARRVIGTIVAQALDRGAGTHQKLTLLRSSMVAETDVTQQEGRLGDIADFNAVTLGSRFDVPLEERRRTMSVTQLAVSPRPAIELVEHLVQRDPKEQAHVYIVSDFRAKEWENPLEIRERLLQLEKAGASLQLVDCAAPVPANLGITAMETSDDTHAAGVPFFVNVTVRNYGRDTVRDIQLKLRSLFYDPDQVADSRPETLAGQVVDMPLELIDEIEGGQQVTRRVQVFFPKPGYHVVEAMLPEDSVEADNHRWCVVPCPEGEPVLVIDGSIEQSESFYLSAAFSPGSRANTGVRPQLEPASYLDEVKPDRLAQFTSVYLLDVPRLNDAGVRNLEHFVRQGGGLCVFAGPNLNLDFYNQQLYRDGTGPMPLPLAGDDLLAAEATENNPDIHLEDHPIFQVLQAERNPLIRMVGVQRYLKPPDNWSPPDDSTVAVIATLRNLQPLVVERQFGQGRVVAVLTSLSPSWNNWARNPSFVVALLRIQAYLASTARDQDDRRVGTPLEVQLDAQRFRKDAVFVAPGPVNVPRVAIESTALQESAQSALMSASIGRRPRTRLQPGDTDRSGVYEFWPLSNEGQFAIERWAFNVNEKEGDLATVGRQQLVQLLDPVAVTIRHVDEYQYESGQSTGFNRSLLLMCLLIPLLLGEQILAYFASYHPPRGSVA